MLINSNFITNCLRNLVFSNTNNEGEIRKRLLEED